MRRKPLIAIGVVLAVVGAAALIWPKLSYTQRETLVDTGPINITADTEKSLPLSPILGGVLLAGGAVLIVVGARKS
jgi:drug/metabolite transporter (DMT)-like permease